MKINRRQFIQQTSRTGLAAGSCGVLGAASAPAGENEPMEEPALLPICDTHQHLWDLDKLRLPWLKSAGELNRSYVIEDYLEATLGLNVVKAVYMEVDVDPAMLLTEAEHVVELCRRRDNPTVAAVIGGRPAAEDFAQYIGRFKDSPCVKGVRQIVHSPEGKPAPFLAEEFVAGIRLLGRLGMSFDLCVSPADLADGAKLIQQCPDTRFIVDHCGNADPKAFRPNHDKGGPPSHDPDRWRRDMDRLARWKNVVCKISGIVARVPKDSWTAEDLAPIVDHCLEVFGPDRVMFGSDWPVCTRAATFRRWVEALKEVVRGRGQTQQRGLLHDNAVRFYGLA